MKEKIEVITCGLRSPDHKPEPGLHPKKSDFNSGPVLRFTHPVPSQAMPKPRPDPDFAKLISNINGHKSNWLLQSLGVAEIPAGIGILGIFLHSERSLPNFEERALSGKDPRMTLQSDFPRHLFGSLKLPQTMVMTQLVFHLIYLRDFIIWKLSYGVVVHAKSTMREVVINDEDGAENFEEEIVFTKLKILSLYDLDSLTSFCSANYTFKFPSLEDLSIIGCPKMKIFTKGELNVPLRVNFYYGERVDQQRWANNDLNTIIQHLHAEKAISTYEERRNMKLIIFIHKAKLIQFMAKLDEKDNLKAMIDYLRADGNVSMIVVVVVVAATKDQKNLKVWLVACGFLAVWALTVASLVIVANLTTFCVGLLLDVAECGVLCLVLDWPLLSIGSTLEYGLTNVVVPLRLDPSPTPSILRIVPTFQVTDLWSAITTPQRVLWHQDIYS
ncbi:hypothetical protein WN944_023106 [Citrus x changshan-huyou]|uniref:Uncharacterized protein n=1 Tax=Citrus x changshan-huyou TaxID=2935761 RepID=A0AAP0N575_9ROSI